ncbi:hypothetical protein DAPPUDRAFT_248409 [Daphnia pulex]|uniref:Reverse transcriptase domain-containing protein n=1 Tax=Daphnia pulex TaxID=6669 RepID=E9GUL6_DAPPU|nr:hypothetical protein DAPPUDRAFT_248409 [Daphnia pulex]|eukprot:EFX76748.1 hypothetical protein DAPPUDRAFT_248409 [Daphnia pulex]
MLQSHFVPPEWETATIIPIRKAKKLADKPESYRPISLTSCLGKMMEKINQDWHGGSKKNSDLNRKVALEKEEAPWTM